MPDQTSPAKIRNPLIGQAADLGASDRTDKVEKLTFNQLIDAVFSDWPELAGVAPTPEFEQELWMAYTENFSSREGTA